MIQQPAANSPDLPANSATACSLEQSPGPQSAKKTAPSCAGVLAPQQRVRICRGNAVIGSWPFLQVMERVANQDLLPTDEFYDEDSSEWFPLAELRLKPPVVEQPKSFKRACYCGTGVPFHVCCGAGKNY